MSSIDVAGKPATRRFDVAISKANAPGLKLLYFMWVCTLFEPERFIPTFTGGGPIMQRFVLFLLLPTLLYAIQNAGARALYLPLALFGLLHALNVPFAYNRGMAFYGLKGMVVIFILFYATVSLIDAPEKVLRILKLFLVSFVWYLVQAIPHGGEVNWHPTLANRDSLGSLAAMAIGFSFYMGMAARDARWRYLGFAAAGMGMLAIVICMARGAILASAVVMAFIWIRSPRKIATLAGGLAAAGVLLATMSVVDPENQFWAEVQSITKEGKDEGTGKDRWVIWSAALIVYRQDPIFGAGAYNVGVAGTLIIPDGTLDLKYANSSKLYNKALHNAYLQILAEEGAVGMALWLWMLVDFWRRTRRMRAPGAVANWSQRVGGSFDLHRISLALECGMIGFLCCAFFYNMTYRHWFFTFVVLAVVISESTKRRSRVGSPNALAAANASRPVHR